MRRRWRILVLLGVFALAAALVPVANLGFGITLCRTSSVPAGFYRAVDGPLKVGHTVVLCLPEAIARRALARAYLPRRGWNACPGGAGPVIKILAAMAGDTVRVEAEGLRVNGESFATWVYIEDPDSPLPLPKTYRLKPGELWLHGPHPRSWDSRHFGPVPTPLGASLALPLWTETTQPAETQHAD